MKNKVSTLKESPYTCIRCGYHTIFKAHMREHFYKKKTLCATIVNNIELTEEIKQHIINFRIYKIPKELKENQITMQKEKSELEKVIRKDYYNYIYLLRPEESVLSEQNIYKIGMSVVKDKNSNISRLSSYRKGSEIVLLAQCINANAMERQIINIFNKRFKRAYGNEYFVGNKYEMMEIIYATLKNEDKFQEYTLDKKSCSTDCNNDILDKFIEDEIIVTTNLENSVMMKDVYEEYTYWRRDEDNKNDLIVSYDDLITYFDSKFQKAGRKSWCYLKLKNAT